ncbi:MAG TPA: alpha/beta fold hydrolase [Solirubrobacterales bacterium]|jgi:pimeloyl-ACP methyl ester carboxylesterase|nr:alpha/beta fold hydrolase [Solirubrobacterales bacterium]
MEPILEHTLRLGGVRTRALELEGAGPPLILLHGFADSADTWRLLLDRVRKQGRAAVALDMPGFGAADRLDGEAAIIPQLDSFADAAIERWAAESSSGKVVIAGNSLGGTVALRAAEREVGSRLAGVVPVAPTGLEMPTWFAAIQGAPLVRAMLRSPVPVPEAAVRRAVGSTYRVLAFASPRKADDGVVGAFTTHFRSQGDVARLLATGSRLLPEIKAPFDLARVRCPVLVVWGERDRMVASEGADRIVAALPRTRVELLPRCGHCPQIEEPDRLAELLATFPQAPGD